MQRLAHATNDLILRPVAVAGGRRLYVLVNARSQKKAAGPFDTLGDAVLAAKELAHKGRITVWHEQVDDKGRAMGPAVRLFSPPE